MPPLDDRAHLVDETPQGCVHASRPGQIHGVHDVICKLERTVDTHIKTLRGKLRAVRADDDPIITHRGLGYSLSTRC